MIAAAWLILCQLSPWLLLGMLFSGAFHVMLPDSFIRRQFHGIAGVIKAVAVGVPLPLCSCGVVPAGIGLKNEGADDGAAVGFLISTPQTGVDSVLISVAFFGWPFAILKMLSAIILGMIGGLLVNGGGTPGRPALTDSKLPKRPNSIYSKFAAASWHGLEIFRSVWVWLFIGVAISAAVEVLVPNNWFSAFDQYGSFASMLMSLAIATPLYICATSSVPMAAVLVSQGLPTSAALVFLMAGPATNTTTISAIYGRFGLRIVLTYLGVIVVGSLITGALFDGLLTVADTTHRHQSHSFGSWVSSGSAVLVLVLGVYCGWEAMNRRARQAQGFKDAEQIVIHVDGMHCEGCSRSIEKSLSDQFGTAVISVSFQPPHLRLAGDVDSARLQQIMAALESRGYQGEIL